MHPEQKRNRKKLHRVVMPFTVSGQEMEWALFLQLEPTRAHITEESNWERLRNTKNHDICPSTSTQQSATSELSQENQQL